MHKTSPVPSFLDEKDTQSHGNRRNFKRLVKSRLESEKFLMNCGQIEVGYWFTYLPASEAGR